MLQLPNKEPGTSAWLQGKLLGYQQFLRGLPQTCRGLLHVVSQVVITGVTSLAFEIWQPWDGMPVLTALLPFLNVLLHLENGNSWED